MTTDLMSDLAKRIQQLEDRRRQHADAITQIDETLQNVRTALGVVAGRGRRGRPPKNPSAGLEGLGGGLGGNLGGGGFGGGGESEPAEGRRGRGGRGRGRRKRGRYETTGDDSILNFVRTHRNPTTKEIKAHWASEKRGGTADNVLSKLVREGKLERESIPNDRGSRYSIV